MFIVIFRAKIRAVDEEYSKMAMRLRELALSQFGCIEFHALTEGQHEIALSYWPDEDSIRAWKSHPEHIRAQQLGKSRWYESYSVEVARMERHYRAASDR